MNHGQEQPSRRRFVRKPQDEIVKQAPTHAIKCQICGRRIELDTDGLTGKVVELVRDRHGNRYIHECVAKDTCGVVSSGVRFHPLAGLSGRCGIPSVTLAPLTGRFHFRAQHGVYPVLL